MTTPVPPQFSQPGKADRFAPRDHPEWIGKLFLVYPDACSPQTFVRPDGTQETSDVVEADVVIVDLPDPQTGQPTVLSGARIGGKGLVPQLKKQVGAMVLGRLSKLPSQGQKDGAYVLSDFTPQDAALATAYVQTHPRTAPFAQPQVSAPPVAPVLPLAPAPAAPAPAVPSPLAQWLAGKGVPTAGMSDDQMRLIAATFPDNPYR
ncbi:hypothetical protein [Actinacidiphila acididurans]|uniref:Uncharacterized protein n=1 Tax=Actinacidiphila acididurans TaxID=2784346 RepID=A0ABS2TMG9_9ACTN|nr:hypothetical protein [Actinacidiphila acididurans]MBM9504540.1 hypothetical protein [Actinacidiphila acididurans]